MSFLGGFRGGWRNSKGAAGIFKASPFTSKRPRGWKRGQPRSEMRLKDRGRCWIATGGGEKIALFSTNPPRNRVLGGVFASRFALYVSRGDFASSQSLHGTGMRNVASWTGKTLFRGDSRFKGGNFPGYDEFLHPVRTHPITRRSRPAAARRLFPGPGCRPWCFGCRR